MNLKVYYHAHSTWYLPSAISQISYGEFDGEVEGVISKEFDDIAQSVNQLSTRLKNKEHETQETYFDMIAMLIKAVEEVDNYTKGHSERVAIYSGAIAKEIGYNDVHTIELSALLHDIGKITTNTSILRKPGPLTSLEFEEIKKHPISGYAILSSSHFFDDCKDAVLYHHERINGLGYPEGLKGDEIPLAAKIIAVADVFDALTSTRSYRDKLDVEEALEVLNEMKNEQLDGFIVDSFIPIARQMEEYAESAARKTPFIALLKDKFYR